MSVAEQLLLLGAEAADRDGAFIDADEVTSA
jgi:hypothetical protein